MRILDKKPRKFKISKDVKKQVKRMMHREAKLRKKLNMLELRSYDDTISTRILREVKDKIKLLREEIIGIIDAGCASGKTHLAIQELCPMFIEDGVEVIQMIAPSNCLVGRESLKKHLRVLEKWCSSKGKYLTILYNEDKKTVNSVIVTKEENEVIFIATTDSNFRNNIDNTRDIIKNNNLSNKVLLLIDEAWFGGTSAVEFMAGNIGSENPKAKCKKFNDITSLLKDVYAVGLTATKLKEQYDVNYGTDKYIVLNSPITKEEVILRTSAMEQTMWYDYDTSADSMETQLLNMFQHTMEKQQMLDDMADAVDLPDDCRIKAVGIAKLQTAYKDRDGRLDKKAFGKLMESKFLKTSANWAFDIAVDTSKDGIMAYRIKNGVSIQLTDAECIKMGYVDSDSLINKMQDKNSPLRNLIIIDKGSMGLDIPNLTTALWLRVPIAKYEGVPIVIMGIQFGGRCKRIKITYEQLRDARNSKGELCFKTHTELNEYYVLVNSFKQICPKSEYHEESIRKQLESTNTVTELRSYLFNLDNTEFYKRLS